MRSFLDSIATFQPRNVEEFFAFQLARNLNDLDHLRLYVRTSTRLPIDRLLHELRQTMRTNPQNRSAAVRSALAPFEN